MSIAHTMENHLGIIKKQKHGMGDTRNNSLQMLPKWNRMLCMNGRVYFIYTTTVKVVSGSLPGLFLGQSPTMMMMRV